jgi:hypothetical protein
VLAQFVPSIKDQSMTSIDRMGLLSDLFASVKSGESSSEDVTKYSIKEPLIEISYCKCL